MPKLKQRYISISDQDWSDLLLIATTENRGRKSRPSVSEEIRIAIGNYIRAWKRKQEIEDSL